MSTESEGVDPYAIVLADLRAKRDQIDQAIQAIESVRGTNGSPAAGRGSAASIEAFDNGGTTGAGAYLGMSIADAAKKYLTSRKQASGNAEIAAALKQGGLVMSSNTDPQNTVGSILTRRFEKVGDVVRVGRGIWGLKEWYPNRSFKKDKDAKGGGELGGGDAAPAPTGKEGLEDVL
jgi:hypothetical protein